MTEKDGKEQETVPRVHPWILDLPYAPGDVREYDREARANHWSLTGILPAYARTGQTIPSRPTKKKTETPKRNDPTTTDEKPEQREQRPYPNIEGIDRLDKQ